MVTEYLETVILCVCNNGHSSGSHFEKGTVGQVFEIPDSGDWSLLEKGGQDSGNSSYK